MPKVDILSLVSDINHSTIHLSDVNPYVSELVYNPFFGSVEEWRYYQSDREGIIRIRNMSNVDRGARHTVRIPFREFLWNRLQLDRIQKKYSIRYDQWKEWNGGVDYVPVMISCDSAPNESPCLSDEFFGIFCGHAKHKKIPNGLSLMMAEYGMGKSSFCMNLCRIASDRDGTAWGNRKDACKGKSLKDAFVEGDVAFPLLFDLNTYRNSDFDEFIENRLSSLYNIHITYAAFTRLCHAGFFCIVLDAWDQMHHTPYNRQVERDLEHIKELCSDNGRVLITCRRSFYQKQLKIKNSEIIGGTLNTIQAASIFSLGGFNRDAALLYLQNAAIYSGDGNLKKIDNKWIDHAWLLNSGLMEKPLNVRLLAGHYETVINNTEFLTNPIRTYHFLNAILNQWKKDNGIFERKESKKDPLKQLVYLTLRAGLNRGIAVDEYVEKLGGGERAAEDLSALRKLDFLLFNNYDVNDKNSKIEFRLAVFQEFLWARYVLEELSERKLLDRDNLLNAYMLPLEVRAWIAEELAEKNSDWLFVQLRGDRSTYYGLQYKNKAEIGYCGSNVLTLYRDLCKVPYYQDQLKELLQNLRHYSFEEADLRGLNLSGADLSYSQLMNADLSYTNLTNVSFQGADLSEVTWEEFGRIGKCAFIENSSLEAGVRSEVLSIAAGTEVGSVLTYNISTAAVNIMSLGDSAINAIAVDTEGVYTASQNGWVGYIEAQSGELKNAYIAANGLESLAAVGRASIYIGAERNGLFRYNWKNGVKNAIKVDEYLSDIVDVNYREIDKEKYIACISGAERKEIVLLRLRSRNNATVIMRGVIGKKGYFDDICFAGDELVYIIYGKGVFSISVREFVGLDNKKAEDSYLLDYSELCSNNNMRYYCSGHATLAWAEEARLLFVLEKKNELFEEIACIHWNDNYRDEKRELEWFYSNRNYTTTTKDIEFCVSADASYLAVSGEKLAVFEWQKDDNYYGLVREPVEANIGVQSADFRFSKGLRTLEKEKFKKRGAWVDGKAIE